MLKIALISASTPANGNTGMITAEFGALSLLKQFPEAKLTWITFPSKPGSVDNAFTNYVKGEVQFKVMPSAIDDLASYDVILYWGDFLNSWTFVRKSAVNQVKAAGIQMDLPATQDMLLKCLLLEGLPDSILKKVILFGGTILSNKRVNHDDARYNTAFIRLIKLAHCVLMRDPVSAARVRALRGRDDSCQGLDPAMLFDSISITGKHPVIEKRIGIFVGSRTLVPPKLPKVLTELEKEFSYQFVWIPWLLRKQVLSRSFRSRAFGFLKRGLFGTAFKRNENDFLSYYRSERSVSCLSEKYAVEDAGDFFGMLKLVSSCKAIITDTYHLNLNAWRLGVPAICIGDAEPEFAEKSKGTLLNLKKFIFNLEFHAEDYYKTAEFFEQPESSNLLQELVGTGNFSHINKLVKSRTELTERTLFRVVRELFEKA